MSDQGDKDTSEGCGDERDIKAEKRGEREREGTGGHAKDDRSENEGNATGDEVKVNPKRKRKMALFMAYLGHGYNGMQVQKEPGVKTIENELFAAIHAAGGISDANNDERGFQKVHWMRSARTDKGVSAVGQVVSLNMVMHPPGMIERINLNLPDQVRVFGCRRVVKGFDSRKACDKRRYEYILPSWVFASDDCSAKRRKMEALLENKRGPRSNSGLKGTEEAADSSHEDEPLTGRLEPSEFSADCVAIRKSGDLRIPTNNFVFDDCCKDKLNSILQQYEGTHNFHNYTVRTAHSASNAKRYIISCRCDSTFMIDGEEWVRLVVIGQSFMMHQIRKMVGMAVATYLGIAPTHCLVHAMKTSAPLLTPMAPELGLFLDECYFDGYNKRWAELHERLSLTDFADEVAEFKEKCIYPHIRLRDAKEFVNASWLSSITESTYRFSTWGTKVEHRRAAHGDSHEKKSARTSSSAELKRKLQEQDFVEATASAPSSANSPQVKSHSNLKRQKGATETSGYALFQSTQKLLAVPEFALHEYSE